jgi:hypothetical protein
VSAVINFSVLITWARISYLLTLQSILIWPAINNRSINFPHPPPISCTCTALVLVAW